MEITSLECHQEMLIYDRVSTSVSNYSRSNSQQGKGALCQKYWGPNQDQCEPVRSVHVSVPTPALNSSVPNEVQKTVGDVNYYVRWVHHYR